MATIADLKKVRQELINKTPLLYQGEVFDKWDYVNGETKLNPPNTPSDFKLVLIKEAINIWDNKTYNLSNLTKIFKPNSDLGNWEVVLKGWLSVKNTLKLDDWSQKGYLERRRAVPEIYEDWDNEITQLTTDKTTAETNLKKYTDTLGTSTPAELKDKLTTLDQAKTKAEQERDSRPNINLTDYQKLQDNQEKHTDYDTIKKERDNWVVIFPSPLTPDLVKVEYDKPKETHNLSDLKPTDLPDNWKEQLATIPTLTANQKPSDYDTIKSNLETIQTNLKTANEKIATLENDKTNLNNQLTSKDTTISDLQNTIKNKDEIIDGNKGLDQKLIDLNQQLSDKDTELGKRTEAITSLTTEKTDLETKLEEKDTILSQKDGELAKLKEQQDNYLKKLLETYKEQITDETEMFYQSLDLDSEEDIKIEYGGNYLKLLDAGLNGEIDLDNVINAFKLFILIIATEKAETISNKWIDKPIAQEPQFRNSKLEYFKRIKKQWDVNWGLKPTETNNPLWHFLISDQNKKDFRVIIRDIVIAWQRIQPTTKTTIKPLPQSVRMIELDTFPIERTSFGLLREVMNRKARMKGHIQSWKDFSPQIKSVIEAIEAEHVDRLNSLNTETQYVSFQIYFDYFNKRSSILKELKPIIIQSLTDLFKEDDSDDKIIKFLKQVALEQLPSWKSQINAWQAGVAGLLFMKESLKTFYLGRLVLSIFNSLNTAEVKFEEIQEPLKNILTDKPDGIFTLLYSGFNSTDKQRDLEDFEKGINQKLKELEVLINNTRDNKKNEEHQTKDKEYLNKLLEIYKTQITEETETFYSDLLDLDESKNINPKYWGRGERADGDNPKSYLEKLKEKEFNGNSEPLEITNAFKIVALICATEKMERISNEVINKPIAKQPAFKKNKLEQFNKVKKQWDLNSELNPVETNNPLYLPIIKDKETYKNKINEIIDLWQRK